MIIGFKQRTRDERCYGSPSNETLKEFAPRFSSDEMKFRPVIFRGCCRPDESRRKQVNKRARFDVRVRLSKRTESRVRRVFTEKRRVRGN